MASIMSPELLRDVIRMKPYEVGGSVDVRSGLEQVFKEYPVLRARLLDEHGIVRPRVAVFLDGRLV
jgi:hypothetical protein